TTTSRTSNVLDHHSGRSHRLDLLDHAIGGLLGLEDHDRQSRVVLPCQVPGHKPRGCDTRGTTCSCSAFGSLLLVDSDLGDDCIHAVLLIVSLTCGFYRRARRALGPKAALQCRRRNESMNSVGPAGREKSATQPSLSQAPSRPQGPQSTPGLCAVSFAHSNSCL